MSHKARFATRERLFPALYQLPGLELPVFILRFRTKHLEHAGFNLPRDDRAPYRGALINQLNVDCCLRDFHSFAL